VFSGEIADTVLSGGMADFGGLAKMVSTMNENATNNTDDFLKDINGLPENLLVKIFSYIHPAELSKCALVCHHWHTIIQHPNLWRVLKLRPDYKDAIHIRNVDHFMYLLNHRFNSRLEYIELPIELITANLLHELANRCPNLKYLTLDFSAAMQLQDFNDLNAFPCNLKTLTICLSEVIFLEGFMRRIYSALSSLEVLNLVGTLETSNDPDESYETINIGKIKSYTPNLRVINLYGITFIDDNHIESIASGCIHLECMALFFCSRFKGYSLKVLLSRCRKLKSLFLQNTIIENEAIMGVEWDQTVLEELDLNSTDLSEDTLTHMLGTAPNLSYLSVAYCDGFTDKVLQTLIANKKTVNWSAIDLSYTVDLDPDVVFKFLLQIAPQLKGLIYCGNPKITEQFWGPLINKMVNLRIACMGTPHGWFKKMGARIHIDQIIEAFAAHCPYLERLEIQWDPEMIRFNYNSRKFIDHIRLRCSRLKSLVLSDGEYYEMMKSNFERAERHKIIRTMTAYHTNIISLTKYHGHLLFN